MLGKKPARKNRFKKKRKARSGKWLSRFVGSVKLLALMAVLLAASALFMAGYAAVTQSDYFRTKSIGVGGHKRLSREAVLVQAQLRPGDNLLAVNLGLVRKRLLAHPWIASARVTREIPERISITIGEHAPLAVVDLGRKFLLNRQGRIFKVYQPKDPQGLPLVTGIVYADISLGSDPLTPAMEAVTTVLALSRYAGSALPYQEIKRVHMDQEMGISMQVWQDQRTIKLGFSNYQAKYHRLKQLLPHIKGKREWRNFNTIDVNNPDRIVVRLGSTSTTGA